MDWKKIFDSVGLNGTWWQWRILKFQERWNDWRTDARTRASNVAYEHRICRKCGGLIHRDTSVCPRCGAKLEHWRAAQVRRAFGLFLPGGFAASHAIIAANIAIMAAVMLRFGGMNLLSADVLALVQSGALVPQFVGAGEWWRIITYAFLHGGLLHIGFNMSSLTQVGPITENEIGRSRFWVLYFLCAIGGAGADIFWHAHFHNRPLVVGASGAIFGLIGFGLTFNHFYGGPTGRANSKIYLQWAVYSFAFGFIMPHVDNVCHLGGFLTGAVLGFIIERDMRAGDRFGWLWRTLAILALILTIAAFAIVAFHRSSY